MICLELKLFLNSGAKLQTFTLRTKEILTFYKQYFCGEKWWAYPQQKAGCGRVFHCYLFVAAKQKGYPLHSLVRFYSLLQNDILPSAQRTIYALQNLLSPGKLFLLMVTSFGCI
jgi:hypothetical protein